MRILSTTIAIAVLTVSALCAGQPTEENEVHQYDTEAPTDFGDICSVDAPTHICQSYISNHIAFLIDSHLQELALAASSAGGAAGTPPDANEFTFEGEGSFTFDPALPPSGGAAGGTLAPTDPDRVVRVFDYGWVDCYAGWNDSCDGEHRFMVPPGWQACRKEYRVASRRDYSGYDFTPTGWYTGDPENPDRFRGYDFEIDAEGSGNPLDRWSAYIKIDDIRIHALPASATNEDRFAMGCEMPAHGGGTTTTHEPRSTTRSALFSCARGTCIPNKHIVTVSGDNPRLTFHRQVEVNLTLTGVNIRSTDGVNHYSSTWPDASQFHRVEVTPGEYEVWPSYFWSTYDPQEPLLKLRFTYPTMEE